MRDRYSVQLSKSLSRQLDEDLNEKDFFMTDLREDSPVEATLIKVGDDGIVEYFDEGNLLLMSRDIKPTMAQLARRALAKEVKEAIDGEKET